MAFKLKRKNYKKKMNRRKPRVPRTLRYNGVHRITRIVDGVDIKCMVRAATADTANEFMEQSSQADRYYGFNFQLMDILDAQDFINIFEQFRIDKVVLKFTPTINKNTSSYAASSGASLTIPRYGNWYTVIDDDNSTAQLTKSTVRQYGNCKVHPVIHDNPVSISINKPKFRMIGGLETDGGTLSNTNYSQVKTGYLDCDTAQAQNHYGLRVLIEKLENSVATSGNTWFQSWRVTAKYFISFKGAR